MKKTDLHRLFTNYLKNTFLKRSELVSLLADMLHIERESVSRRLNEKVLFTVKEMGIIANELNISIDNLLNPYSNVKTIPVDVKMPFTYTSYQSFINHIETKKNKLKNISTEDMCIGSIIHSFPMEIFAPYPSLSKFMYYKWGHYFIGNKIYQEYSSWQVPDEIIQVQEEMIDFYDTYKSIFCILDPSLIWNLVNDIKYFSTIRVFTEEDVSTLKQDLHSILNDLEKMAKGIKNENQGKLDIYIASININLNCYYIFSSPDIFATIQTSFMQSELLNDYDTCNKIRDWIDSLKKISTLISRSGEVERRIFFDKQHIIVDKL